MDNGGVPGDGLVDQTDQTERRTGGKAAPRATSRSRNAGANGGVAASGERRKSPPRPRKPASSAVAVAAAANGEIAVADRIDPLLAVSSAALDGAQALASKPVRRRPPARKSALTVQSADDPATTELPINDDFFAEPKPEVAEPVKTRVKARAPYVLPKIIPGEPEPETESQTESVPALELIRVKVAAAIERFPFKPQFRGVTKRLKRSLQPVVLPRHRPRVRRVTRVVRHIDTWSVFKIALLFNIFLYAVCLTAGAMLWRVALNTGTIENIERFFESFGWQTFQLKGGEIYHNAWIIGLFGVVGLTGLAVLAATMFNLITDLVGGVRITVLEEEVVAREQRVVTWPRMLRPPTPPGGKSHDKLHDKRHDTPPSAPPID